MDKKDKKTTQNSVNFPPVVAVLGHVDHGKTTLLDAIRKTNVAAREHGGITQKIGASTIELTHDGKKRKITFIDTPGHEAFSKMRGRGVLAADIGLLIVSETDGVMPQTKESIAHLNLSKLPFIVVLTKSDLPERNPEKVKNQLLKEGIKLESVGGDVPIIEVSAKTNTNIKELLELILLAYDLRTNEAKVSSSDPLKGIIIESKLDLKAGPKATVIVKNGTIRVREEFSSEGIKGKIRSLVNDKGEQVKEATIGEAVEVLGFADVPKVGSVVTSLNEEVSLVGQEETKEEAADIEEGLPSFIIRADSEGSLEAIKDEMPKGLKIVYAKTGDIDSSDILFAKSIGAIVLGFNIRIKPDIARLAEAEKILTRNYTLIYEMIDEVNDLMEGKRLSMEEKILGKAKILAIFPYEKTKVLGISVLEGRVAKGDKARVIRNDVEVGFGTITSVRVGKEPTSKVEVGKEAGVILSPFLDFTIGDMLISLG